MTQDYGAGTARSRQVLVYLHGHGSSPSSIHPYFRQHHDDGWVRVCPQATVPTEGGWSWFRSGPRGANGDDLAQSVDAVRRLVEGTLADLDLAWSDVVLGGFSQGGATALAVASALARDAVLDQDAVLDGDAAHDRLGGLLLQAAFVPEVIDDEVDLGRIDCGAVLVQHGDADEVVPSYLADDLGALIGADRVASSDAGTEGRVEVERSAGGHTLTPAMLEGARRWLERRSAER